MNEMTIWTNTGHPCKRMHKSYPDLARCLWSDAEWVEGSGQWATVALCSPTTVMLHTDQDTAVKAYRGENGMCGFTPAQRCGSTCAGNSKHLLVKLK